ncbi:uncharacterized protein LOC134827389 [Culicoides brevitarsis]|uniref:uncharacterized protein LOC134827389 n=1 Tax=Culicoides brevitarsis TaxID=469753 RepID=UPI00307B2CFB
MEFLEETREPNTIETEDYFDDEEEPIESVVIAPPKKIKTVVLASEARSNSGKQKIIQSNENEKFTEHLQKYKSKGATECTKNRIIEGLNCDCDDSNSNVIPTTSIQERFEHRKRVISATRKEVPIPNTKKIKFSNISNTFEIVEGRKIYWNTEKDLKKAKPHMLDTELLDIILGNQIVADMKLNTMYKRLNDIAKTRHIDNLKNDNNASVLESHKLSADNNHSTKSTENLTDFSQIPIRNNDEFESFESELKMNSDTVARFELMLENLGSPENYSDLIKRITSKLFTPNFMESLGWSQTGLGGLQLKETTIKECIYNVFARKYIGIQEEVLNEKFSQHFRSFRLHRNKVRSKQKRKTTLDESSS